MAHEEEVLHSRKTYQVKDVSDEEVVDACNAFWTQMRSKKRRTLFDYDDLKDLDPFTVLSKKYPPRVVLRKMKQMVDRGILEYGTSIHTAWVK